MGRFSPEYLIDVSRLRQVSRHWGSTLPSTFPRDRFPTPGSGRGRWDPNVRPIESLRTPSLGNHYSSLLTYPQWGIEGGLERDRNLSGIDRVLSEMGSSDLLCRGSLGLSNCHPLFLVMVGRWSS